MRGNDRPYGSSPLRPLERKTKQNKKQQQQQKRKKRKETKFIAEEKTWKIQCCDEKMTNASGQQG